MSPRDKQDPLKDLKNLYTPDRPNVTIGGATFPNHNYAPPAPLSAKRVKDALKPFVDVLNGADKPTGLIRARAEWRSNMRYPDIKLTFKKDADATSVKESVYDAIKEVAEKNNVPISMEASSSSSLNVLNLNKSFIETMEKRNASPEILATNLETFKAALGIEKTAEEVDAAPEPSSALSDAHVAGGVVGKSDDISR